MFRVIGWAGQSCRLRFQIINIWVYFILAANFHNQKKKKINETYKKRDEKPILFTQRKFGVRTNLVRRRQHQIEEEIMATARL